MTKYYSQDTIQFTRPNIMLHKIHIVISQDTLYYFIKTLNCLTLLFTILFFKGHTILLHKTQCISSQITIYFSEDSLNHFTIHNTLICITIYYRAQQKSKFFLFYTFFITYYPPPPPCQFRFSLPYFSFS